MMPAQYRVALLIVLTLLCCRAASAQGSAAVSGDEIVKAGEDFNFTITLDQAPNFDGGGVQVVFTEPDDTQFGRGVGLKSGQTVVRDVYHVPLSAAGGKWRVKVNGFEDGSSRLILFKPAPEVTFLVIPKLGLIYPSSAQVTVNPSQQQFLRKEALRLQDQLQNLKAAILAERSESRIRVELLSSLAAAVKSLDSTEIEFRRLDTDKVQSEAAKVFFDDLRVSYRDIQTQLNKHQLRSQSFGSIVTASMTNAAQANGSEADYPIAAKATFRAFEQNELAYNTVANAETLIFNLTVTSNPSGAVVSYRRRGDPYHQNPDPTNTVITALPLAIWTVQFQKVGYKTIEREHDPFTATNHVINVELEK